MTSTSTGAPSAHSLTLDRRSLLGAAPVIAAAVAVPAIAITTSSSAWDAAMRAYELAKAEDDAFTPIYWRTHAAWEAGKPSMDGIDWQQFPFRQRADLARCADLDKELRCFLAGEGEWWFAADPEKRKAEFRAALDSVRAFREAEAAHDRDSGMDAAEERWEALGDRVSDAASALMDLPAPDFAALRWKLDQLLGEVKEGQSTACWSEAYVRQTIADYRRLLGEA